MYIKCPRCMLNYINEETEQYCKVCLVDMGKIQGQPELDLEEEYKLCPECGENYLEEGEEICYACRLEHMKHEEKDEDSIEALTAMMFFLILWMIPWTLLQKWKMKKRKKKILQRNKKSSLFKACCIFL